MKTPLKSRGFQLKILPVSYFNSENYHIYSPAKLLDLSWDTNSHNINVVAPPRSISAISLELSPINTYAMEILKKLKIKE